MQEKIRKLGLDPRVHRIPNRFRIILTNLLRARKGKICECRWTNPPPDDSVVSDGPILRMCECGRPFDGFTEELVRDAEERFSRELEKAGRIQRGWQMDAVQFFTIHLHSQPHYSAAWQLVRLDGKRRTISPALSDEAPDLTMQEIIMGIRGDRYDMNEPGIDWERLRSDLVAVLGVKNERILDDVHDYFMTLVIDDFRLGVTAGNVVFVSLLEQFSGMMDQGWGPEGEVDVG